MLGVLKVVPDPIGSVEVVLLNHVAVAPGETVALKEATPNPQTVSGVTDNTCLLYTSDAADD